MNPNRNPCGLPDCRKEISPEWLFCENHWRMVPRPLRLELARRWRQYRYGGRPLPPRFFEAFREAVREVARALAARRTNTPQLIHPEKAA